jgi:hypothetical protein
MRIEGAPFSKLPLGLLAFLGIQNLGRYPNALDDAVYGELDLWGLFGAAHNETLFDVSNAISALNFNQSSVAVPPTDVPINEVWRVHEATFRLFTSVGEAVTAALWVVSSTSFEAALTGPATLAASQQAHRTLSQMGTGPIWLPPGCAFGAMVDQFTGAPNYHFTLHFTRFKF